MRASQRGADKGVEVRVLDVVDEEDVDGDEDRVDPDTPEAHPFDGVVCAKSTGALWGRGVIHVSLAMNTFALSNSEETARGEAEISGGIQWTMRTSGPRRGHRMGR